MRLVSALAPFALAAALSLPAVAQDMAQPAFGPGTITIDLARRIGEGNVIGIDRSEEVVAEARAAAAAAGQHDTGDVVEW